MLDVTHEARCVLLPTLVVSTTVADAASIGDV